MDGVYIRFLLALEVGVAPARGSAGGGDGKRARITVNGKPIDYTRQYTLNAGDVVVLETGGGGGFGGRTGNAKRN